jgi:hypothetical protein
MPFKYSCFISYCHGQHELMQQFMKELTDALKAYVEPWVGAPVFIDEERLKPGYLFNEALAEALCHSVCMIVVYSPSYEDRPYCLREYAAMEALQEKRFRMMGRTICGDQGMIIPIIFRGKEFIPPKLKSLIHYANFSKFTLAETGIKNNPPYIKEIEDIATHIYQLHSDLRRWGADNCEDCASFVIPDEAILKSWRDEELCPAFPLQEPGR